MKTEIETEKKSTCVYIHRWAFIIKIQARKPVDLRGMPHRALIARWVSLKKENWSCCWLGEPTGLERYKAPKFDVTPYPSIKTKLRKKNEKLFGKKFKK
jgi:hypothetical protein